MFLLISNYDSENLTKIDITARKKTLHPAQKRIYVKKIYIKKKRYN